MKYYIYEITNKITGKNYIGQHKSNNPNTDKYMGSGAILKKDFKVFGKENFKKRILCYCNNQEELNKKEVFYISKYRKIGKAEYNIKSGGKVKIKPIFNKDNIGKYIVVKPFEPFDDDLLVFDNLKTTAEYFNVSEKDVFYAAKDGCNLPQDAYWSVKEMNNEKELNCFISDYKKYFGNNIGVKYGFERV